MNTLPTPLPEIMTAPAVLELLEISRATLYRMEKRGLVPFYRFAGKKYYRRSEIVAAITANREPVPAPLTSQAA